MQKHPHYAHSGWGKQSIAVVDMLLFGFLMSWLNLSMFDLLLFF